MTEIIIGPTGIGSLNDAVSNLEEYARLGFRAAEVLFTHRIYIKKRKDAEMIGEAAKRLGISLSIHAPYYINLNSNYADKVVASKRHILDCCEIGHYMGAKRVIVHPGFYSGMTSLEARVNIATQVKEMMKVIEERKWDVELCLETMGKINVFGSIEEIAFVVRETGCSVCIDFAHVLARYGEYKFEEIEKTFLQKKWQCHFSGIIYGDKGEKKHKVTVENEWRDLFEFLKRLDREIIIINESPTPIEDCLLGLRVLKETLD